MCELLIAEYEKKNRQENRGERRRCYRSFLVFAALFFLVLNQLVNPVFSLKLGIDLSVFTVVFVIYFFPGKQRGWEDDIETYMGDLACMEKILQEMDIDTYNKLGLVMDGIKMRLDNEEKEKRKRERISAMGILSIAAVFSLLFAWRKPGGGGWESMLSCFLAAAAFLEAWAYIMFGMRRSEGKIERLYELLMNVMITRF